MLAKPDVLDYQLAGQEGEIELVLGVEAGEWETPEALELLKHKADRYAQYALDGEMHQSFPDSVGKKVSITVVSVDPVPPFYQKWLDAITRVFARDGLAVNVVRAPA